MRQNNLTSPYVHWELSTGVEESRHRDGARGQTVFRLWTQHAHAGGVRLESLWPASQLREFTASFANAVVSRIRPFVCCVRAQPFTREGVGHKEGICHVPEVALHGIQFEGITQASSAFLSVSLAGTSALFSNSSAIIVRRGICHCRGCISFLGAWHHFPVFSCSPRLVGSETWGKDLISLCKRRI